jgi:endonuclease YncB( thermonuclease family)
MAARRSPRRKRPGLVILVLALLLLGLQYLGPDRLRLPAELQELARILLLPELDWVLEPAGGQDSDVAAEATPAPARNPAADPLSQPLEGLAVRITDGDTFTLRYSSTEEERIRLHGIDAPERDQPHGRAAGEALASLIGNRRVRVELVDRDRYGRLVGRIWLGERDINLAMVEAGHAWWYEQYARKDRELERAQAEAQRAGLGLWNSPNPVAPWDWRRGIR